MSDRHYEGGTPHKDDPRQLEPNSGSAGEDFIQAPKLNRVRVTVEDVLVAGETVEINPLEFRGTVRRIQAKKVSGSATTYDLAIYSSDPAGAGHHDFDEIESVTGIAVASAYDSGVVDVPYENTDDNVIKRSLYATITPDDSATPNVFDLQLIVEQRV